MFPADLSVLGGGGEGAGRGRGELHLLHVALLVAVEEVLEARRPAQRAQRAARRAPQRHGHVPRLEPENRNTQDNGRREKMGQPSTIHPRVCEIELQIKLFVG